MTIHEFTQRYYTPKEVTLRNALRRLKFKIRETQCKLTFPRYYNMDGKRITRRTWSRLQSEVVIRGHGYTNRIPGYGVTTEWYGVGTCYPQKTFHGAKVVHNRNVWRVGYYPIIFGDKEHIRGENEWTETFDTYDEMEKHLLTVERARKLEKPCENEYTDDYTYIKYYHRKEPDYTSFYAHHNQA